MNVGDKILITYNISLRNLKGFIVSSLPPVNSKTYLVKISFKKPLFVTVKESEFIRVGKKEVRLSAPSFFHETGCDGTIVGVLPRSHYLCEFDEPFCNIILKEKEIMKWEPEKGVFALLDVVRLTEDFPEYNLKKGAEGTIVLVFFKPSLAYDVEFHFGEDADPPWDNFTFSPHHLEFVRSLSSSLQN